MAAVFATQAAHAETRTLKLYFVHTKEKAEITFKRNGRYDATGLRQVNQFLRDWRRNEPTKMDPRLLDLVWEAYQAVGARDYIHVVSAYRSPATNSMLRSRSKGVAKKSQHMLGKAMDFYIPGVSLKKLRDTGLKMQVGGVGYYPTSGSPFVHFDVGNVRHWPRLSRQELVSIFPNGKTLHVPSDGKPLPGFEDAVASYEARRKNGTTALALASPSRTKPSKSLLAALFGGGADEDEEAAIAAQVAAPQRAAAPAEKSAKKVEPPKVVEQAVEAKPAPKEEVPGIRIVPPDQAKRVDMPAVVEEAAPEPEPIPETPETIIASLSPRNIPIPQLAPRPKADVGAAVALAQAADPAAPEEPASIPFGMAREEDVSLADAAKPAEAPVVEVAVNIPVPTPRPGRTPPSTNVIEPQDTALLALVSTDRAMTTLSDANVPLPQMRDAAQDSAQHVTDPTLSVIPMARPELTVGSVKRSPEEEAALAAALRESEQRVAALADAAQRSANATAIATDDDTARTTRKAARPTRKDGRPDRKAVVVAAQPDAARWALSTDMVTQVSQSTTAPSFAYNAVITAPREVYTAGFHREDRQVDPNRFSGKAVEFLSVARFE